jgi:hypothetical protein
MFQRHPTATPAKKLILRMSDDQLNNADRCKLATTQIRSFSLYDSGAADCGEHRQGARAFAEALIAVRVEPKPSWRWVGTR